MAIYFNLITFIINKKIITKENMYLIALLKEIDPLSIIKKLSSLICIKYFLQ